MAVTAISLLKGYFTCDDEAVKNKYYNLLESFFHKSEGNLVTGTAVVGDALVFSFSDGSTQGVPLLPDTVPVSFVEGLQDFLNNKVDKVQGKGLSTEDFTNTLKQKLDALQNYVHPDFHQIGEITGLPEALDSKVDKVAGKELSTNDFTTGEKETLATVEAHVQNEDIHVTAAQKKTYANKLKTYVSGEVLDDLVGDIFRIFGNKIYSLNAALPYTTNDIEAEAAAGDWTVELAAPEAGLTFKDADGIDQFTGSFALFEGFGFDAATKKVIAPTNVIKKVSETAQTVDGKINFGVSDLGVDAVKEILINLNGGALNSNVRQYKVIGYTGLFEDDSDIFTQNDPNNSGRNFYVGIVSDRGNFDLLRYSLIQNGLERFSVSDTGNVGIANNNPIERLHVVGNSIVSGTSKAQKMLLGDIGVTDTDPDRIALTVGGGLASNGTTQYRMIRFQGVTTNDSDPFSETSGNNSRNFYIGTISTRGNFELPRYSMIQGGTEHLTMQSGGNLGLGVTNPTEKLEVNGKIKATSINFSGLPTSDTGLTSGDVWNDAGTLKIV